MADFMEAVESSLQALNRSTTPILTSMPSQSPPSDAPGFPASSFSDSRRAESAGFGSASFHDSPTRAESASPPTAPPPPSASDSSASSSSGDADSQEAFTCGICIQVLGTKGGPSSLPCGHNGCLECLKQVQQSQISPKCPFCREPFRKTMQIKLNCGLRDALANMQQSQDMVRRATQELEKEKERTEVAERAAEEASAAAAAAMRGRSMRVPHNASSCAPGSLPHPMPLRPGSSAGAPHAVPSAGYNGFPSPHNGFPGPHIGGTINGAIGGAIAGGNIASSIGSSGARAMRGIVSSMVDRVKSRAREREQFFYAPTAASPPPGGGGGGGVGGRRSAAGGGRSVLPPDGGGSGDEAEGVAGSPPMDGAWFNGAGEGGRLDFAAMQAHPHYQAFVNGKVSPALYPDYQQLQQQQQGGQWAPLHAPSAPAHMDGAGWGDEEGGGGENAAGLWGRDGEVAPWEGGVGGGMGAGGVRGTGGVVGGRTFDDLWAALPPEWVPDSGSGKCMVCEEPFRPLVRTRHHCRFCGLLLCHSCSSRTCLLPPLFRESEPQRVCERCHDQLEPLQPQLVVTVAGAAQRALHDVTDATSVRAWVNNPLGWSLQEEIFKATNALRGYSQVGRLNPERSIPAAVLGGAVGLAILTVAKVGVGVTYRVGTGLVVCLKPDRQWSAPSAIATAGIGWGAQMGGEIADLIVVIRSLEAMQAFCSRYHVAVGASASAAAGPLGRAMEADVRAGSTGFSTCYTYSCSKGAFVGMSWESSLVASCPSVNHRFYGTPVSTTDILFGRIPQPMAARPLYDALRDLYDSLAAPPPPYEHCCNGPAGVAKS